MSIICCKRCKRIFDSLGGQLCSECHDYIENSYLKVSQYMVLNPDANVQTVATDTGVEENLIISFVKEGRILCQDAEIICVQCGRKISQGIYCEPCLIKLEGELTEMSGIPVPKPKKVNAGKKERSIKQSTKVYVNIRQKED